MIIDVSVHNGPVDFSKVKDVQEVFVRASLGYGTKDKMLINHAEGAARAGIPVSYYHFAYPSNGVNGVAADAAQEANYFIDTIQALPPFKHIAVDLEGFGKDEDTKLSKEDYAVWLQTFLDTVEVRRGVRCVIYSYADYLNRHLPKDHKFGEYDLWIAHYTTKKDSPNLPEGWSKYFAWQYSESGTLAGVNGVFDLSRTV